MAYRIEVADLARHDRDDIFDYLVSCYLSFGDDIASALARAVARIEDMQTSMETLATVPFQGTVNTQYAPNIRSVTKNRMIFWFKVDEAQELVTILAIFFGGQDHQNLIRTRLFQPD